MEVNEAPVVEEEGEDFEVLEDLGDHYLLLPAEGLAAWDSPT